MPKQAERRLRREAQRKFPGDREQQDRYVYGTLRHRFGWKPAREASGSAGAGKGGGNGQRAE